MERSGALPSTADKPATATGSHAAHAHAPASDIVMPNEAAKRAVAMLSSSSMPLRRRGVAVPYDGMAATQAGAAAANGVTSGAAADPTAATTSGAAKGGSGSQAAAFRSHAVAVAQPVPTGSIPANGALVALAGASSAADWQQDCAAVTGKGAAPSIAWGTAAHAKAGGAAAGNGAVSNRPSSSGAAGPSGASLSTTAVYQRYQALRREFGAQQRARAPAIVADNKAKLAAWVPSFQAALRTRKSVKLGAAGGGALQALSASSSACDDMDGGSSDDDHMATCSDDVATDAAGRMGAGHMGADMAGSSGAEGRRQRSQQRRQKQQQRQQPQKLLVASKPAVVSMRDGKVVKVPAKQLPLVLPVPEYVTWEYLRKNELALDIGRRMFYKDETGETIPASDDEEANVMMPWEGRNGPSHDHALLAITNEHGDGVLPQLAQKLKVGDNQLLGRLQQLRVPNKVTEAERLAGPFKASLAAFTALFCRRCRVYDCKLHDGKHVKPSKRPAPPQVDPRTAPCCSSCWKLQQPQHRPQHQRQHAGAHISSTSPVAAAMAAAAAVSPAAVAAAAGAAAIAVASATADMAALEPPTKRMRLDAVTSRAMPTLANGLSDSRLTATYQHQPQQQHRQQQPQQQHRQQQQQQQHGTPAPAASPATVPLVWSEYEVGLLAASLPVFGRDPCKLALVMEGRSCVEVAGYLAGVPDEPREPAPQSTAKRRHGGKASKTSAVVLKRMKHQEGEDWPAYEPCNCIGPCVRGQCSCIEAGNFCEKFCACNGSKCSERFEGCRCKGGCKTMICPCLAAGRECDPDLCIKCAPNAAGGSGAGTTSCCNMNMRLGRQARISMGLSTVAGWGAFLRQDVRKGDFLGEYVGDVLSQEEANRRGLIYDRIDNSYLFNVNQKYVIDARQRGNKMRFANHSPNPNCQARVLMVDGDHRVAIYAKEDIAADSELFYNYRYDVANAPGWALKDKEQAANGA